MYRRLILQITYVSEINTASFFMFERKTSKKPARIKRHTKRAAGVEPELFRPLRYSQRTNGNRAISCKGLRRTMINTQLSTVWATRDKSSVCSAVASREVPSCSNYFNSDGLMRLMLHINVMPSSSASLINTMDFTEFLNHEYVAFM